MIRSLDWLVANFRPSDGLEARFWLGATNNNDYDPQCLGSPWCCWDWDALTSADDWVHWIPNAPLPCPVMYPKFCNDPYLFTETGGYLPSEPDNFVLTDCDETDQEEQRLVMVFNSGNISAVNGFADVEESGTYRTLFPARLRLPCQPHQYS